jgi:signal transduction histidine kinase/DNA-binding response OmpR family regulator
MSPEALMEGISAPLAEEPVRFEAEELRAESLNVIAAGLVLLSVGWYTLLGDGASASSWLPALLILGLCALSLYLARRRFAVSGTLLVFTLGLGTTLFLWTHPWPWSAYFYVATVIAGGTLLGPLWAVGLGLGCSAILVEATGDPSVGLDGQTALGAGLLVWFGVLLTWAAASPVYAAMAWAWSSYLDAQRQAAELRERQGELNRVLASLNDTCYRLEVANEELARARAAAEEARQLKTEFAANISHELRTPLNLIIGFSEILMTEPGGPAGPGLPPASRADVDVIYRNAKHLSNLIDDVLDLSQIDAGRMGLSKERIDLRTVAAEAINAIARLYEVRGLTLTNEVPPDLPPVYADRTRIRQVLINLLNNAARFTPRGGASVGAHRGPTDLVVEVADTGVGIAEEDIPKVFEEFRQLDGTTRRSHDGSGLGLAICRRFIEMHGGAIWATSQPGAGTMFSFSLPMVDNVVSSPPRPEWDTWVHLPMASEPVHRSVVLINRDPRVEHLFRRYLDGYQVLAAADEAEALRLFDLSTVHGVVLTVAPNADRTEALHRLRETPRNVPIIACSLPTSESMGERLGVVDYLVKPIARERLLDVLARLGKKVRMVLIVDDDPEMVRLLARMVRSGPRRYQVLRAYGGEEALQRLRDQRVDAVILDLVMPSVDGYAVLREMRLRDGALEVPVVAVTARSYEAETVAAPAVEITREGGLSIGELMTCVRSSLDAITTADGAAGALIASPAP